MHIYNIYIYIYASSAKTHSMWHVLYVSRDAVIGSYLDASKFPWFKLNCIYCRNHFDGTHVDSYSKYDQNTINIGVFNYLGKAFCCLRGFRQFSYLCLFTYTCLCMPHRVNLLWCHWALIHYMIRRFDKKELSRKPRYIGLGLPGWCKMRSASLRQIQFWFMCN